MGRRLGWLWTERRSVGALLPSYGVGRDKKSGYKGQRNGGQQQRDGERDRVACGQIKQTGDHGSQLCCSGF